MNNCPHLNQRRFGRTDETGTAVVERRCADCGQTIANGRVSSTEQLVAIPGGGR